MLQYYIMPKDNIVYSNTIIYKIYCKDENITDVYVGHTTNFPVRKCAHKNACANINKNLKIYKTIRENGGWDNWDMVEIETYNCSNSTEARIKEQEHYEKLNASLNGCSPHVNISKYVCNLCDFGCTNKSDWAKHIQRQKHLTLTQCDATVTKKPSTYLCKLCDKKYVSRNGLWNHKKKCCVKIEQTNDNIKKEDSDKYMYQGINIKDKDALLFYLLKQNGELQSKLIELASQVTNNITNIDLNS